MRTELPEAAARSMRAVRFAAYGEPAAVLRMDDAEVPAPAAQRVRVKVHACGLNPADWALCRGLFAGSLPRGVGLEVAGTVDAVGEGVVDAAAGDKQFVHLEFLRNIKKRAADFAILQHWTPLPGGLDPVHAAALPMAVAIAVGSLDCFPVTAGSTVLIHGAGTTVGFAAVQVALRLRARVLATAGDTFAGQLRGFGAAVTPYGEGMVERVRALSDTAPDFVLDTAPASGALPALVEIAGDPQRVMTISDFAGAAAVGARANISDPGMKIRYDVLGKYAELAAKGEFLVPVAATYPLEDWRAALEVSESRKARGKLVLLP